MSTSTSANLAECARRLAYYAQRLLDSYAQAETDSSQECRQSLWNLGLALTEFNAEIARQANIAHVDLSTREYLVLRGTTEQLSRDVTWYLREGWELAPGGYACIVLASTKEYSQVIYRE